MCVYVRVILFFYLSFFYLKYACFCATQWVWSYIRICGFYFCLRLIPIWKGNCEWCLFILATPCCLLRQLREILSPSAFCSYEVYLLLALLMEDVFCSWFLILHILTMLTCNGSIFWSRKILQESKLKRDNLCICL